MLTAAVVLCVCHGSTDERAALKKPLQNCKGLKFVTLSAIISISIMILITGKTDELHGWMQF